LADGSNALRSGLPEHFGMQVITLLHARLVFLRRDAICIRIGVVANASHLPRDLYVWFARPNDKTVAGDLFRHNRLGKLADHGQLVAEPRIECFEIVGENHRGKTVPIGRDVAVVNVHHVRRFDK
jgi:hypothetical protein